MTEKELIDEGFEKIIVTRAESDNKKDYYYYVLRLSDNISLFSCDNEEAKEGSWYVSVDMYDNLIVYDMLEVIVLINLLKKWLKDHKNG
jgi:hypothetical protein